MEEKTSSNLEHNDVEYWPTIMGTERVRYIDFNGYMVE